MVKEGDTSYWNISRYDPMLISSNPICKALEERLIEGLYSLHNTWRDNQCKEVLETEPKTIRIKRYNKFKLPESNKRNDIKPLTLDLDFIKRFEEDK